MEIPPIGGLDSSQPTPTTNSASSTTLGIAAASDSLPEGETPQRNNDFAPVTDDLDDTTAALPIIPDATPSLEGTTLPTSDLPEYVHASAPNFRWGDIEGEELCNRIDRCYEEIVHWKRNLFKVPSGRAGKAFARETTRLLRAFSEGSALESVALKAIMVMPSLLLQKPHTKSKTKEHSQHLERRMQLWSDGNIEGLLEEGRTVQRQLRGANRNSQERNKTTEQSARTFAKLMMEGKVKAALRLISEGNSSGVLHLDSYSDPDNPTETVRETLLNKHPNQQPYKQASIVTPTTPTNEPHPIYFDRIDGHLIRSTALRTEVSAGPLGLDAAAWKRLCTSFKSTSTDLCEAIAATARRISTSFVDPQSLSAFVACGLVALDKCPGVRPIGIGETLRRILGRAIAKAISEDIQIAAGPLQLYMRRSTIRLRSSSASHETDLRIS